MIFLLITLVSIFILDTNIEVGPSTKTQKKYCDITGFETKYQDKETRMRFYNTNIYRAIKDMPEPIVNQYLALRKANFVLK